MFSSRLVYYGRDILIGERRCSSRKDCISVVASINYICNVSFFFFFDRWGNKFTLTLFHTFIHLIYWILQYKNEVDIKILLGRDFIKVYRFKEEIFWGELSNIICKGVPRRGMNSLSLSLSHTHTHTLSLSISLSIYLSINLSPLLSTLISRLW